MSTRRSWTAGRVLVSLLAVVIALGLAAPAGASASSATGGAGSATGGAGSATGGASSSNGGVGVRSTTEGNPRIGHVTDPANDVRVLSATDENAVSARHLRTIDITRFGYHFGERTAKITLRTRDLRTVPGTETIYTIRTRLRSSDGLDDGIIFISGIHNRSIWAQGGERWCPGLDVRRDVSRSTLTVRVPMRCLAGDSRPTSMQASVETMIFNETFVAEDRTYYSRRADLRS